MKVSLPDALELCVGAGRLGAWQWHTVASRSPWVGRCAWLPGEREGCCRLVVQPLPRASAAGRNPSVCASSEESLSSSDELKTEDLHNDSLVFPEREYFAYKGEASLVAGFKHQ